MHECVPEGMTTGRTREGRRRHVRVWGSAEGALSGESNLFSVCHHEEEVITLQEEVGEVQHYYCFSYLLVNTNKMRPDNHT